VNAVADIMRRTPHKIHPPKICMMPNGSGELHEEAIRQNNKHAGLCKKFVTMH
jgi:hypothetical protein